MYIEKKASQSSQPAVTRVPGWLTGLLPLLAIIGLVLLFSLTNPLALFRADLPPIETLTFERIRVTEDGFQLTLLNGGPDPVTVAQVLVDDAYWQFAITPNSTIPRLGRAMVTIPYTWIETEPHFFKVITSTGVTFDGEVAVATVTPTPGRAEFLAYGLLGVYVGIIPVGLGLLWYPAMKRMGRRWLGAILALTVGLLVFLLVDTFLEALEVGAALPGVFQPVPLVLFAALLTWLVIMAVGSRKPVKAAKNRSLYLAGLIALSIGLHNFGEGLAVGAAFSLGEAALGSFLVIGFILHNITEGVGIAAPLVPSKRAEGEGAEPVRPVPLLVFIGLMLLAGFPAVLGTWIGGFAFSPLLAVVFLGIGVGAIWQVIVEVTRLLQGYAQREGTPLVTWLNLGGFLLGLAIMYFTAYLVKF